MTALEFYRKHLHALVSTGKTEYKTEPEIFERAKEMEKEQIIEAFITSRDPYGISVGNSHSIKKAEQYYNETFKSE